VPPDREPLNLFVTGVARELSRAFDAALTAVGGSVPAWLVLRALQAGDHRTQAELAAAVGVRQPTLTHHLDSLEKAGLITRERPAGNRRVQHVATTDAGDQLFVRLRRAAAAFDGRLRAGLDDEDVDTLRRLLADLVENAQPD
jgi:MarR family transcriptional regulator for hemolysin